MLSVPELLSRKKARCVSVGGTGLHLDRVCPFFHLYDLGEMISAPSKRELPF